MWDKASAEFYFAKSRELLSRPFPSVNRAPHSSCRNLSNLHDDLGHFEHQFQNMSFEDNYYRPQVQYRDRTLTKSESMARKIYDPRYPSFYHNANGSEYLETSYIYYKTDNVFEDRPQNDFERPRTLSFNGTVDNAPKKNGRSIRDRNRRRQSYNPKAYESSSSESDCVSVGSVDFDWRRRRRLSRLSTSNSSIRSEMCKRSTNPFLKPNFSSAKMMGRSPPPSSSILSGLSPTSAARCQRTSNSTTSDSSL